MASSSKVSRTRGAIPGQLVAGSIVGVLISLALHGFVLYVVHRLETNGCQCAMTWQREFIERLTIFMMMWITLVFIVSLAKPGALLSSAFSALSFVVSIMSFTGLLIGLHYTQELRNQHCNCSMSASLFLWEVLMWVRAAIIVFSVLLILLMFLTGFLLAGGKKKAA